MVSTGIVRRIDDLGRVVIPREIRRRLHIHEGDALEIFINNADGSVTFKPYQMEKAPSEILNDLIDDIDVVEKYHPFINRLQKLARDMEKVASE